MAKFAVHSFKKRRHKSDNCPEHKKILPSPSLSPWERGETTARKFKYCTHELTQFSHTYFCFIAIQGSIHPFIHLLTHLLLPAFFPFFVPRMTTQAHIMKSFYLCKKKNITAKKPPESDKSNLKFNFFSVQKNPFITTGAIWSKRNASRELSE